MDCHALYVILFYLVQAMNPFLFALLILIGGSGCSCTLTFPNLTAEFIAFDPSYLLELQRAKVQTFALLKQYIDITANISGADTSCPLQILTEIKFLLGSSANFTVIFDRVKTLQTLLSQPPSVWPPDLQVDINGNKYCSSYLFVIFFSRTWMTVLGACAIRNSI